jgi:hypothetical protein
MTLREDKDAVLGRGTVWSFFLLFSPKTKRILTLNIRSFECMFTRTSSSCYNIRNSFLHLYTFSYKLCVLSENFGKARSLAFLLSPGVFPRIKKNTRYQDSPVLTGGNKINKNFEYTEALKFSSPYSENHSTIHVNQ